MDKLTDLQITDLNEVKYVYYAKVYEFMARFSGSRELSLAYTNLEQSELWFEQHIKKHGSGKTSDVGKPI